MDNKSRPKQRGAQPGNENAQTHGFYSDNFSLEELSLIAAFSANPSLDDEIWLQRVLNRRLASHLAAKRISTDRLIKIAGALAVGTGRVARLLRDKRALSGDAADGLNAAIVKALDELSTELGIEL